MSQPEMKHVAVKRLEPALFTDTLENAEILLKYAAEAGIEIDTDVRNAVLDARSAHGVGWAETTAANLLESLTKLAAKLKPVTAESLKASEHNSSHAVRTYWKVAIMLAIVVVPFSLATFVSSAISDSIRKDIAAANEAAVKLNAQLTPVMQTHAESLPEGVNRIDVVTGLQAFASSIRAIDSRAQQLDRFLLGYVKDPYTGKRGDRDEMRKTFQLKVPLVSIADLVEGSNDRLTVYQEVRAFGQDTVDDVSVFYGAITTCILPVLYALLGTCAYLLRSYEQEMRSRTFALSHSDYPRFMIAAIAGAVVGLFNNLTITQGASIPPLAIAFLVGYAVDVFFSFLEGLIQSFTKNNNTLKSA